MPSEKKLRFVVSPPLPKNTEVVDGSYTSLHGIARDSRRRVHAHAINTLCSSDFTIRKGNIGRLQTVPHPAGRGVRYRLALHPAVAAMSDTAPRHRPFYRIDRQNPLGTKGEFDANGREGTISELSYSI